MITNLLRGCSKTFFGRIRVLNTRGSRCIRRSSNHLWISRNQLLLLISSLQGRKSYKSWNSWPFLDKLFHLLLVALLCRKSLSEIHCYQGGVTCRSQNRTWAIHQTFGSLYLIWAMFVEVGLALTTVYFSMFWLVLTKLPKHSISHQGT